MYERAATNNRPKILRKSWSDGWDDYKVTEFCFILFLFKCVCQIDALCILLLLQIKLSFQIGHRQR